MSDRTRAILEGETCARCHAVAWGGECWHPTREGVECAQCHSRDTFQTPRREFWRVTGGRLQAPRPERTREPRRPRAGFLGARRVAGTAAIYR